MIELATLISFIGASTLLCLAPGPDNIFVLTLSSVHGRKAGLWVTLGICSGLIVHTLAVALGLAILIQNSDTALQLLKITGAFYLLYLAKGALSAPAMNIQNQPIINNTAIKLFQKGAILNISNPKVALFFLAFLPQFIPSGNSHPTMAILLLGFIFMLIAGLVFGSIAILSGSLGHYLRDRPSAQSILNKTSGVIFILLAVKLLFGD